MQLDIKELAKTVAESLNLKDFKGDVVAVKVVENEIGTIEEGGIGIQNVYHGVTSQEKDESAGVDDALLQQLTPMFFGDNAAAANFLRRIKGVKAQDVTSIVNELVKEKVLSANCAHRDLWKVLHEADLYPRSESNWNIFVK